MRCKRPVIASLAVLLLAAVHAGAGDKSLQLWFDQDLRQPIAPDLMGQVAQSFRFSDSGGEFSTWHLDGGVSWHMLPWLDLGGHLRYIRSHVNDAWWNEVRPYTDATLYLETASLLVSDRNRLEYRFIEGEDDLWRYRNKLTVQLRNIAALKDLKPYLAAEQFVDNDVALLYRNRSRFSLGIKTPLRDELLGYLGPRRERRLSADYFVMYQSTEQEEGWLSEFILGATLGIRF